MEIEPRYLPYDDGEEMGTAKSGSLCDSGKYTGVSLLPEQKRVIPEGRCSGAQLENFPPFLAYPSGHSKNPERGYQVTLITPFWPKRDLFSPLLQMQLEPY